jgi:PAS domain S-box-containing protein
MNGNTRLTAEQQKLIDRKVFEESDDPIMIVNREGTILYANHAATLNLQDSHGECPERNRAGFLPPEVHELRKQSTEEAFRTGKLQIFEGAKNGRIFRHCIYPVRGDSGVTELLYIRVQDITDLIITKPHINFHAAFTTEAMEAFPGAFTILDATGRIISCNSYFRNLIARKTDTELSGTSTFDLFHPDDQTEAFKKLENILQYGTEQTAELRILLHGGPEYRWFRITTKRLIVDHVTFLVSSGIDIDKYKKKEQQLSLSNEQLRFVMSESKTGSWEWQLQSDTVQWSEEIWELYGIDRDACKPSLENWKQTILEDDRQNTMQEILEASKQGIPFRCEWRVTHADGSMHWLMSRGLPFRDNSGKVIRYLGIVIDITESKEHELLLKKSEERFRNFFEQHSAVMMILDPETGHIVDVNNAAAEYYGWSKEQLRQMNVQEMNIDPEEVSRKRLDVWKTAHKRTFTVTHRKADGTLCDIEVFGKKINVNNRWLAFLILHDITERKQFQQALIAGNERMHFILNASNAGIWDTDTITAVSNWSDELWRLHGIEPQSFPLTFDKVLSTVIPEDRALFEQTLASAVSNGSEFNYTWRIKNADGAIRWLMGKGNPVKNANGMVVKFAGITLDVTEQKQTEDEKKQLESRIQRSERLETLGNLAGGIAHDFNNILTPILNYAEMGMMELPETALLYDYFSEITKAAERAQNLVYQILTFSRSRELESSNITVQSVIEEALKLIRPSIPATIRIEKHIDSSCRNVLADPSKIYQVILNLCTNAWQAMEENGGTMTIALDELTPDSELRNRFSDLHEQPYVRLSITDTGHGMDKRTMQHIFEPFFTTKPVNRGTGLGLSVVQGIIHGHNGVIDVESVPGKGSTFRIFLPVSDTSSHDTEPKPLATGGAASILLVDDEKAILDVMSMMLTHFGHKINAQNSPVKALELFCHMPGAFDVVITDLTMPEMTGIKLAMEMASCNPDIPVILMTGYEKGGDQTATTKTKNIAKLLKKPIRFDTLLSAINEVVGKKGGSIETTQPVTPGCDR